MADADDAAFRFVFVQDGSELLDDRLQFLLRKAEMLIDEEMALLKRKKVAAIKSKGASVKGASTKTAKAKAVEVIMITEEKTTTAGMKERK